MSDNAIDAIEAAIRAAFVSYLGKTTLIGEPALDQARRMFSLGARHPDGIEARGFDIVKKQP